MRRITINKKYKVLLFDLGSVLVDVTHFEKALEWQTWTKSLSEFEDKFYNSYYMNNFNRGVIGTKEFFDGITGELDITISISRFLREFRLLPKGFYPGVPELMKELSKNYWTGCFSNTNEIHWNKLCDVDNLEKLFKYKFASHLIHEIKPDPESYQAVLKGINAKPEEIAFFDDKQENVDAAIKAGMNAFKINSFKHLCDTIVEQEIL